MLHQTLAGTGVAGARGLRRGPSRASRALGGEHALERRHAAGVERGAGARRGAAPSPPRASTRRGRRAARSARRRRRRRRGSACRGRASSACEPVGYPLAVEPLVVVAHEPAHAIPRSRRSRRSACAPQSAWRLMTRVLLVVERPGLLQDRVGHRELADVVDERRRSRARAAGSRESPSRSPTCTARSATRRVCCSVYSSFCASRSVSARTCEPRKTSSACDELGRVRGRRRAAATGPCARGRARPGSPTIRIPSSSNMWPSHQPSSE